MDFVLFWGSFHFLIAICFFFDFLMAKHLNAKKAWRLSLFWVVLALLFNGLIFFKKGALPALQFFTAYLVEKSLSLDNLLVILLIFNQFPILPRHQRKILFWGLLGAICFRLVFIVLGVQILAALHWMIYLLGALLCLTGIKFLTRSPKDIPHPKNNWLVRLFSFLPVSKKIQGFHFFVRENNRLKMTHFFLALLMIESTDILFALDSIPAVLAITADAFIAYTSNIFAVLGLRSLYFVIQPLLKKFKYLNWGLSLILLFIGVKMLLSSFYPIPLFLSFLVIICILCITAFLPFMLLKRKTTK